MKYLKYPIAILATLFLVFLGRGFITPSISYGSEITVDKPIKEAWAVMNDESKISEWLKGITNVEHVSGEKGTVGAVTKYTFDDDGSESTVIETIKDIKPDKSIIMTFEMEGAMRMNYFVEFTEKEGGTHIKSNTTTIGEGIFMRSLVPFLEGTMKAQEDENMANLKNVINENTTNYFPAPVVEEVQE